MSKVLKIFSVVLMVIVVMTTTTPMVFADATDIVTSIGTEITNAGNNPENANAAGELTKLAGKVINLIQIASAVAAVILIAVFGFKFILGSANEKADYQKSFIPLIVGVVVVFAATSIAKLLFGLIK